MNPKRLHIVSALARCSSSLLAYEPKTLTFYSYTSLVRFKTFSFMSLVLLQFVPGKSLMRLQSVPAFDCANKGQIFYQISSRMSLQR
jgi:hypothetical protein